MGPTHPVGQGGWTGGRRWLTAALIGVGAALFVFALGMAFGESSRADYVRPEEHAALRAGIADLEDQLADRHRKIAELRDELDERDAEIAEFLRQVVQRRADLATREAELQEREEALSALEERTPVSAFGNGVVVAGKDVEPGDYRTAGPDGSNPLGCYFAFRTSTAADAEIMRNELIEDGQARASLAEGDVFESSACQQWVKQR